MKFFIPTSLPSANLLPILFGGLLATTSVSFATEFEHSTYLKASNAAANSKFGSSVAIDGNLAVVGAPYEDSSASGVNGMIGASPINNSGSAYVFLRTGVEWNQIAHLKAPNPVAHTNFGVSVTVSGSLIAIGYPAQAGGGRVHIYRLENGAIVLEATLAASNAESGDSFGSSVSLSSQSIVVGAPSEDSAAVGVNGTQTSNTKDLSGAAYVFRRTGTSWTQEAYLKASNTDSSDRFGASVALSGNTIVVGALDEDGGTAGINGSQSDNSKSSSGAAYVFVKTGSVWAQQAYLKASNTDAGDNFGEACSIDGDNLLVGAPRENSNGRQGAAYLFRRSGSAWSQIAHLKSSTDRNGSRLVSLFGIDVVLRGNLAVVGSINGNLPAVFQYNGSSWMARPPLALPQLADPSLFGRAVALSGNTILIGDPDDQSNSNVINGSISDRSAAYAGSVHIFTPSPLESTTVRNMPVTISPMPPNGVANKHFQLSWQPSLGNRYDLKRSINLIDWTSFPGYPAPAIGTQEVVGNGPKEFYKVVDIDATPPDGILAMYPAPGGFAVPRFADIRIELNNASKVIPSSLKLTVGTAGPFTLADSQKMNFANGVLHYDVIDTALVHRS